MDYLNQLIITGTAPEIELQYEALPSQAKIMEFGLESTVCILDTETTGLVAGVDAIIEIAIVKMQGPRVIDEFLSFVNPRRPVSEFITELTSITDAMVADAPDINELKPSIIEFIGDCDIVAHNAAFDRSFVEHTTGALPGKWIDTIELARIALPRLRAHSQGDLVGAFLPENNEAAHRASHDAHALSALWRIILCGLATIDLTVLTAIASLAPREVWPEGAWVKLVADHLAGVGGATPKVLNLSKERSRLISTDKASALWDAYEKELSYLDFKEVADGLSHEGLAGLMYPDYESRQEQIDMACEINDAFTASTHLAVEAGTGVGKSLAYLIPAALFALRNEITVGVATKTNTLTDQLVYKELPLLSKALDGKLRFTALKGYDHYVCLRKVDSQLRDMTLRPYELGVVLAWISQTAWGDIDSLNFYWRSGANQTINANSLDCSRRKCRYYPNLCYLHGARQRARSSHIVVTNHALLFRDTIADGAILPPARYWIVDEAHGAEAEARDQLSVGVDQREFNFALKSFTSRHAGLLDQLRRVSHIAGEKQEDFNVKIAELEQAFERLRFGGVDFFDSVTALGKFTPSTEYDSTTLRIDGNVRREKAWTDVESYGSKLYQLMDSAVAAGKVILSYFEDVDSTLPHVFSEFNGALFKLGASAASVAQVVGDSQDNCFYTASIRRTRQFSNATLSMANIEMGSIIAEQLYTRANSVVFTSATLAAGSDFEPFARGVGLTTLPSEKWKSVQLRSSYNLEQQMQIYIPRDMPSPANSTTYSHDLEKLLFEVHRTMGGGVLTLFTNRREMDAAYRSLKPQLEAEGITLLSQSGGQSRKILRERFIADHSTSLFATKSFWEGFDAQGQTLRCVVIPRLPFSPPTDPLYLAREELVTLGGERGSTAWMRYSLPETIVELKQAVGRLIRSSTDVGCVIIADPRAATARYAAKIQAGLPVEPKILSKRDMLIDIADRYGVST